MSDAPAGVAFRAAGPLAPLQRAAMWTAGLSGWKRHGFAACLGVLAAAALSPVDMVPLLVIAFSGLIWLMDGCVGRRDAALLGWSFGFGFFLGQFAQPTQFLRDFLPGFRGVAVFFP